LVDRRARAPARGTNILKLKVSNHGRHAQHGEHFQAHHADHGHPTPVQPVTTFDASTGLYTIDSRHLFMPGVWRLQIDGTRVPPTRARRSIPALYFFCIEG